MNAARKEVLSEWRQVKKNKLQEQEKQVFSFRYIPPSFQDLIIDSYVPLAEFFLSSKAISDYSQDLVTFLYYQGYETRGKMKNSRIHMYGIPNLSEEEFLAVFIHEFAHYYDIYELPANAF